MLNSSMKSRIYAFGTVLLWASAFVFTKVSLTYFTVSATGILRYIFASLFLLALALIKRIGLPRLRDIPKFVLSGGLGFTLYMITFNEASRLLSSATGSIIIATAPIMTVILARLLLKEKIRLAGWIAIVIEFIGILILTLWNGVFSANTGIFWMIGAAFCISGYNLSQRFYTKKYTALQSTTYSIFAGTILLLIYLPDAIPQLMAASAKQLAVIVFLGIFPSAIAYIWWSKALSLAEKTSDVTNFMFVTPLLAMIMGYLVIMEIPTAATFIGGSIIIIGLIMFNITYRKDSKVVKESEAEHEDCFSTNEN